MRRRSSSSAFLASAVRLACSALRASSALRSSSIFFPRGFARRLGLGNFLGSLGFCRLPCLVGLGSLRGCLGVCHSLRRLLRSSGVLGLLGFLGGFFCCLLGLLGSLGVRYPLGFVRLLGLRSLARFVGLLGVVYGFLGCLLGFLRLPWRPLPSWLPPPSWRPQPCAPRRPSWRPRRLLASAVFLGLVRLQCFLGLLDLGLALGRIRRGAFRPAAAPLASLAVSAGLAGPAATGGSGLRLVPPRPPSRAAWRVSASARRRARSSVGGAAPSASLRMIDWKRWLDRVSQSSLCSSGAGLLATAAGGDGFAAGGRGGTGAGAAPPPCASLRMIDRYSRLECSSHRTAAAHGSSPLAGSRSGRGRRRLALRLRHPLLLHDLAEAPRGGFRQVLGALAHGSAALPPPSAPPDCARATGAADGQHRQHARRHASSLHGTLASSCPDPRAPVFSDSCGRTLR